MREGTLERVVGGSSGARACCSGLKTSSGLLRGPESLELAAVGPARSLPARGSGSARSCLGSSRNIFTFRINL
jgi:hypothetical protein